MSSNVKNVTVEDMGTYPVASSLSQEEIRRQLQVLLGVTWLSQATVCVKTNGDLEFKRPPAGTKGN